MPPGRRVRSLCLVVAGLPLLGCDLPPERTEQCFNDHDCPPRHLCQRHLCVEDPCGNGEPDEGEECDPGAPALSPPCRVLDERYVSGQPGCTEECELDTAFCVPGDCTDGALTRGEDCDLVARPEAPCSEIDKCLKSGVARCVKVGCTWDRSACVPLETCGDGRPHVCEECDPTVSAEWDCKELGDEWVGTVRCLEDCTVDRDGCRLAYICGNGVREADRGEECDDGNTEAGDGCSPLCRDEWGPLQERPLEPPPPGSRPQTRPFAFESACFREAGWRHHGDGGWLGIRVLARWIEPPGEGGTNPFELVPRLLEEELNPLLAAQKVRLVLAGIDVQEGDSSYLNRRIRELIEAVPDDEASRLRIFFAPIPYAGMAARGGIALNPEAPVEYLRRVALHQLGHFLGLPHTHACPNGDLPTEAQCETTGDSLCSTPPDPGLREARDSCYGRILAGEAAGVAEVCEFDGEGCRVTCSRGATPDLDNVMSGYPTDGVWGRDCGTPHFSEEQSLILRCVLRNERAAVAFGECSDGRLPQEEACDGRDDDCDGRADEGAVCVGGKVCEGGRCVPGEDDPFEDNEALAAAADLDLDASPYVGLRVWHEDEDWYRVRVGRRQRLSAEALFLHADGDVDLELRGADAVLIAASSGATDGEAVRFETPGEDALTLFLRVFLAAGDTNRYDLGVRVEDIECPDADQDGYGRGCEPGEDCDDLNPAAHDPGAAEVCDGLDNDCDEEADEGDPGGGGDCETGELGVCGPGVGLCSAGEIQCVPLAAAGEEVCDGLDNDCDGDTDEGDPGGGGPCDTGGVGVCAEGTEHCLLGRIACVQDLEPAAQEDCNGRDDGCDGEVDEGHAESTPGCPRRDNARVRCLAGVCTHWCLPGFVDRDGDLGAGEGDGCETDVRAWAALGDRFTCVRDGEGEVECWGEDHDGSTLPPAGAFVALSATTGTVCGIREDGTLACWGSDDAGQGSPPEGSYVQVSVGTSSACAIRADGRLVCWGGGGEPPVQAPEGVFTEVAVGSEHACALLESGELRCWRAPDVEIEVPAGPYRSIVARRQFVCAILPDFGAECWDLEDLGRDLPVPGGELGVLAMSPRASGDNWLLGLAVVRLDGTTSREFAGVHAPLLATPPVATVAVSDVHACALQRDGRWVCRDDDDHGQGVPPEALRFRSLSAAVRRTCGIDEATGAVSCWGEAMEPPEGAFQDITLGWNHGCGLRQDSGEVECWGRNPDGGITPPEGERFRLLRAGSELTCGLRQADGAALCWGADFRGQLDTPQGSFVGLAVGDSHGCGLRAGGDVVCWGDEDGFEGTPEDEVFESLAAGGSFTCGLRADGSARCWGSRWLPTPEGERFSALAAGRYHACGIRRDSPGAICWGGGAAHARTGLPEVDYVQLQAGFLHTCALLQDGSVVCTQFPLTRSWGP